MVQIYVYNKSTVVSNNEVAIMVAACNILIKKVCFIWNLLPVTITHLVTLIDVNYIFYIIDNTTLTPNMVSCYTSTNGKVSGYILAKNILNNGGVTLYKDATTYTVAAALFHEIVETIIDPTINTWWRLNTLNMVAGDICNPVLNNLIVVQTPNPNVNPCNKLGCSFNKYKGPLVRETPLTNTNVVSVALCDFLYPTWFDPILTISTGIVYNYANTLTKPFSISSGGYVVLLDNTTNKLTYKYGSKVPAWQKTYTQNTLRNVIRKNNVNNQVNNNIPMIIEINDWP